MSEEKQIRGQVYRIEELIHDLEALPDEGIRAGVLELVQALMDFHSAGLARMMEAIAEAEGRQVIFEKLSRDELVSSLLLVYGLHPLDLECHT